jgi:hypothetical protein
MTEKPCRLVTVCIEGTPARRLRTHTGRLKLLANVVEEINRRWDNVDAVVFPGGFLQLNKCIGSLDYVHRVEALNLAGFVNPIKKAAKALPRSSGSVIVLGIDGPQYPNDDWVIDQFCVAVDKTGVVGIARKIFPVKGDEADWMLCFDSDFSERHRVVKLRSGRKAILAACYDMFGFAERGDIKQARAQNIQWIGTHENQIHRGQQHFANAVKTNLRKFKSLLAADVTVGIAAIHEFGGSSTGFWQRHGIAACSAALNSGFAIGAAHFAHLPQRPNSSTLGAARVPRRHLKQGHSRKAHSWAPKEHFEVTIEQCSALVRLFCS